jgi:hypothetical protein
MSSARVQPGRLASGQASMALRLRDELAGLDLASELGAVLRSGFIGGDLIEQFLIQYFSSAAYCPIAPAGDERHQ